MATMTVRSSSSGADKASAVLIVVMGTSGSGKSTLGAGLADALDAPFVDGDDLHPKANVERMASGMPLTDADRLPWLLSIRKEALKLCATLTSEQRYALQLSRHSPTHDEERVRQLAETHETTHVPRSGDAILDEARRIVRKDEGELQEGGSTQASQRPGQHRACVIACSALKQSYRRLLRHGLAGVSDGGDSSESSNGLEVYHVYVRVSAEELLRRMHDRKGHFMKESMLQSQLTTLEEPQEDEERMLVMRDGPVEDLVHTAMAYFAARGV